MVLGNQLIKQKGLVVPFNEENLQPASYDISVGEITGNIDWELKPGESVLISTKEWFSLPNDVAAFIKTRSSLARIGLEVGETGGWVDPGYNGNLTLFMKNKGKKAIDLRTLDRIGQIIFLEVSGVDKGYSGNYQNSKGITRSVLDEGQSTDS